MVDLWTAACKVCYGFLIEFDHLSYVQNIAVSYAYESMNVKWTKYNICPFYIYCIYTVVFTPFTAACSFSSIGIMRHF